MKTILVLDGVNYPIVIVNIVLIKIWRVHWGTLIIGNELVNPMVHEDNGLRTTITLPCVWSRSWCLHPRHKIDCSHKIKTILCLEMSNRRLELTKVKAILERQFLLYKNHLNNVLLRKMLRKGSLSVFGLRIDGFKGSKLLVRALTIVKFTLTSKLLKGRIRNRIFKQERHYKVASTLISEFNLNVHQFIFNNCLWFDSKTSEIYNATLVINFKKRYITDLIVNHLNKIGGKRIISLRYTYFLTKNRFYNLYLVKTDINSILLTTGFIELLIKIQLKIIQLSRTLSIPRFLLEWRNISMLNQFYLNYLLSFIKITLNPTSYPLINLSMFILDYIKTIPNLHFKSIVSIT
ncbi:hypothetical protein trycra_89 [Candidatus Hodgkinia cicadicola]|uniref:Uncharacterized protein n=1 Tax=Candidatus Hodgkinia cicadicola TaxID=573658 RepID=A0ABX4MGL9_9HYPH|nr:hypothetical protein trycra_89 [Candidatus Hodgkinia cicadicola]